MHDSRTARALDTLKSEIITRRATLEDAYFIAKLDDETFGNSYVGHNEFLPFRTPLIMTISESQTFVVICSAIHQHDEVKLGFAAMQYLPEYSYIAGVAVGPSARRHGCAGLLLDECKVAARNRARDGMIWLHVAEHNEAARRLFERNGFVNKVCEGKLGDGRAIRMIHFPQNS
jgi:ribosomal protein S18 acetylase RimI-like enzyme